VKNLTIWRQNKFFGGQNTQTPPSQLESNQVVEILNMLPNRDGSEAKLRTGFVENPWTTGTNTSDLAKCVSMLACSSGDPDAIYRVDGILSAKIVSHSGHSDLVLFASMPDEHVVPDYHNINDEMIWTSGVTPPNARPTPPVVKPPTPERLSTGIKLWKTHCQSRSLPDFSPTFADPTISFSGVYDYWVNDETHFDTGTRSAGKNESYWFSESDTVLTDAGTNGAAFLAGWDTNGIYNKYIKADIWANDTEKQVLDAEPATGTDLICYSTPYFGYTRLGQDSETTLRNPTLRFPSASFRYRANIDDPLYLLFDYGVGSDVGAIANAYIRNAQVENSPFTKVNVVSGVDKPIYLQDQATLDSPAQSHAGTGTLTGYIVCSASPNYTDVEVKIEFAPTDQSDFSETYPTGGHFVGFVTGAMPAAV
jgi:hypothetical protein